MQCNCHLEVVLGIESFRAEEGMPELYSSLTFEKMYNFHLDTSNIVKECVVANLSFKTGMAEATSARREVKPVLQINKWLFEEANYSVCNSKGKRNIHVKR